VSIGSILIGSQRPAGLLRVGEQTDSQTAAIQEKDTETATIGRVGKSLHVTNLERMRAVGFELTT